MTSEATIGFTGATGRLGREIGNLLSQQEVPHRAIARDLEDIPETSTRSRFSADYDDIEAMQRAFEGLDRVFLVSTSDGPEVRKLRHRNAISAARAAGVGQIIFLSLRDALPDSPFPFAAANHDAEVALRDHSVADWTILHPNLYMEALFEMGTQDLEAGVLRYPWAGARVGYVSRPDIAAVAVDLLLRGGHLGKTLDVTGAKSMTLDEVCAELSAAFGRQIQYTPDSHEEYFRKLAAFVPSDVAAAFAGLARSLSEGRFDIATDVVRESAGREPQSLEQVSQAG